MTYQQGSFIRWQSTTITQLGYAINLILTFSVAALGFQMTLLQGNEGRIFYLCRCEFLLLLLSLGFLCLSIGLGIWAVINRLWDFRQTANIARKREAKVGEETLRACREIVKRLGRTTWCLFYWQVGTFGMGVFLTVLSVISGLL